tara:strand:+ start:271 stop:1398 length:1128 start_codon:yes stop_codon:yes gene_type:complete
MFSISNFKVEIDTTDISAMVTSMNLYESIHGNVKGTIHVEDKINFFDTFFRGLAMTQVTIGYTYFGEYLEIDMYADGVTDQVITKTGKTYNVTLSSLLNLNAAVTRICNSYSGTSNDILTNLWKETHGQNQLLILDTTTASKGKYVVPNISANECMRNVVNTAYDVNKTGMFLYQRLADRGATRFTSIHTMVNTSFAPAGDNFAIRNEEITVDTALGLHGTIGTANKFTLKDYNKDFIAKLAGGMWGQKITEISLDESTNTVHNKREVTDIEITKFALSKKLYNTEVSLFAPESSVTEEIIMNMKYRLFNTNLHVDGVVAIPNIGCGMTVNVNQGGNTISATKTDGTYLVANINHMYHMDDGVMQYSQNIGLVRE